MHYLAATLHTLGIQMTDRVKAAAAEDTERGSVTIEQVLWAVAVIGIVAIVVFAVTTFVTDQAAEISTP